MKRDLFITILALAHGIYFVLGGAWPLIDMRSFEFINGPKSDHIQVRAIAGISLFIGAALLWCVHRGVIENPMRLVVAGAGGTLAIVMFNPSGPGGIEQAMLAQGIAHAIFSLCWMIILLTADSPYRPRPVAAIKRLRQKT
jgi:hypothetical protein